MLKPLINFDYFGFPVYFIMLAIGSLVAYAMLKKDMRRVNSTLKTKRRVYCALFLSTLISVLCANIYNWLVFTDTLDYPLMDRFALGGFSFYHGMLAFFGIFILLLRLFKQNHRFWVNEVVPSIIIFNIIARIGCILVGCCYGIHIREISSLGLTIENFPVKLLEIISMTVLYFVIKKNQKIMQNRLFWYLASYSIIRFILEFLRGDDRGKLLISWLSPAQITSILIWIGLATYILIRHCKNVPIFKPIEVYAPNIDELNKPEKKHGCLKIIVVIFLLITIAFTWFNPLNLTWCDSFKDFISDCSGGFFKDRSNVSYDAQGNVIMDMKESAVTADIKMQLGEKRTISVNQDASREQTYKLDFDERVAISLKTAKGEVLFKRTIRSIEFEISPTRQNERFTISIEPLAGNNFELTNIGYTSTTNPNSNNLITGYSKSAAIVRPLPFISNNINLVAKLAATGADGVNINGTVKVTPRLKRDSLSKNMELILTRIESAYNTENAHKFIDMVAGGANDDEFAANILKMKGGLEAGKVLNSCAKSCSKEATGEESGFDSIDKAYLSYTLFNNKKYLNPDTKLKDTSLSVVYVSHEVSNNGVLSLISIITLKDKGGKVLEKKQIEMSLVKQSLIEDVPFLETILEGYYIKDIELQSVAFIPYVISELFNYDQDRYNQQLAENGALYSMLAYDETAYNAMNKSFYVQKNRSVFASPALLQKQLTEDGYKNIKSFNYGNNNKDDISFTLAYKWVNRNEILLAVVLRGTDGVEWLGNMEIGSGTRHESFEKANKTLKAAVDNYIKNNQLKNIIFYVTGHSRGAAVSNLFAADLNKNSKLYKGVFCYTFATPNNTTKPTKDSNIFNFCFSDDFVPQVPLKEWKYDKYGTTYVEAAEDIYNRLYFVDPAKPHVTFGTMMNSFCYISYDKRKPSFNKALTNQFLRTFVKLVPSVDSYYTKEYEMSWWKGFNGYLGEENQTMYGFMRNYIGNAAAKGLFGDPGSSIGLVLKQCPIGNDVKPIADFFVEGISPRSSINDTHQAFTYYAALVTGSFETP